MTAKHTPTPWDICDSANSTLIHIETIHGEQIATVNKGNKEQRLANALYMARACNAHDELVAALQRAHDHMAVDARFEHSQTGKQIIAALAKARGEA